MSTPTSSVDLAAIRGDMQAVIDLAESAAAPTVLCEERLATVVVPAGGQVHEINLERFGQIPARKRGTFTFHTADSFARYIKAHDDPGTAVFADITAARFTAVLNGHAPNTAADGPYPGWADHRATLTLQKTLPWLRWEAANGKLLSQVDFATLIEDSAPEIVTPDAATMLELAQTFQAKTGVVFRQATVLQSGQRQMTYSEDTQASAGSGGQITIPEHIELALKPFEGGSAYRVKARFRYRLSDGRLSLGYVLDRPEDVLREAFDESFEQIEAASGAVCYLGSAPQ